MSKMYRFDKFKHVDIFQKEVSYFLTISETLNVSKAAEALGIQQSGLSRALHRLEEDLGQKLFSRKNNGLVLTAAGSEFLKAIKNTKINWEDNFKNLLSTADAPMGLIKIGLHSSFGQNYLPQIISDLNKLFPSLELEIHSMPSLSVVRKLMAQELDFGLVATQLKQPDLIAKVVGEDYLATYQKDTAAVAKYILFNPETLMSNSMLRKISDLKKIAVDDYELLAKSALSSSHLALLPDSVAKNYPHLKQVGGALAKTKISLICQKDKQKTLAYKKIWEALLTALQK
jgi:DNA-binding transcriptional LysR family regulator